MRILVIDESPFVKNYLQKKMEENAIVVHVASNGLEGMLKMRSETPSLIIMEYELTRKTAGELLTEKMANAVLKDVPVIMISSSFDKGRILELSKFNVRKFLTKPIKIDALFKAICEILNVKFEIDATPSLIETHFNDDILFVEVAMGLNWDKIDLLKFKIAELMKLYKMYSPRTLVVLSNLNLEKDTGQKIYSMFDNIFESTHSPKKAVKVLSTLAFIKSLLAQHAEYSQIEVVDSLDKAIDSLLDEGLLDKALPSQRIYKQDILSATKVKTETHQDIQFQFETEGQKADAKEPPSGPSSQPVIAITDDDEVIREIVKTAFAALGWTVKAYSNGREFLSDLPNNQFDLLFIDLMMPIMNGFEVLQELRTRKSELPVVVLSALTRKETVIEAKKFGITSYLVKPIKPKQLHDKAAEILKMSF